MAILDLWERLWQGPLDDTGDPQDGKLAIHAFWGLVSEWDQGYETQQNVQAIIDLASGEQQSQAVSIKQHINACPDKQAFIRMAKDWCYIAESEPDPEADKYRDWDAFVQRMADEVTSQGGTPP